LMMRFAIAVLAGVVLANAQIANVTVVSAASFEPGLPANGSIATLFCTGLEGIPQLTSAAEYPLPRELAGVQVFVSGKVAPLYAAASFGSYQQVNFQVPIDADAGDTLEVAIEHGSSRGSQSVKRLANSPGEFFLLTDGSPALQHADYSLVTANHPAHAGETLMVYLTGMHGTTPEVPTGEAAPFDPLAVVPQIEQVAVADIVRISFAGIEVQPQFAGLVPGMAGVYQINFVVPQFYQDNPVEMMLVRTKCTAFFGSCQAGGGVRTSIFSRKVQVAARR
jgi:uncharacterized protein (TIGR03437 family)